MNKLSQRLTQLRKQVGHSPTIKDERIIHQNPSRGQDLSVRIHQSRLDSSQRGNSSCRSTLGSKKISDVCLAATLGGHIFSEGLIYLRTRQALSDIHHLYDAGSLIHSFRYWPEKLSGNCDDLLFIDTETTGLSGGVGTLVFLLGVAEIKDGIVINHQFLLNGLRGEAAMLSWFNEKLSDKKTLVSYNGKSFDIPLLVNRFRLLKIPSPLLTLDHIDLVHWTRRLYKTIWPDCCLPTAEKMCLNFFRQGDVSGAEAPEIWGQLIRKGDTSRLKLLLRHHFWDVLSLVGLLDFVLKKLETKSSSKINAFSIANYYFNAGNKVQAKNILEINRNNLSDKGALLLASIYRKENNYESALKIWGILAENNYEPALEYLAKHYEHVRKEHLIALDYTQHLIELSSDLKHVHRKNRLLGKMNIIIP